MDSHAASVREITRSKRIIRLITHAMWIMAFPIFGVLGVLGREILISQGVPVVQWAEAKQLFIPFALFHLVPVLLYSFLIRRACFQSFDDELTKFSAYLLRVVDPSVDIKKSGDFTKMVYAVFGSCVCVLLLQSISLFVGTLATGPGGFAEVVIMTLAMFPLTLGYLLVISLVAAGVGGLVGSWFFRFRHPHST